MEKSIRRLLSFVVALFMILSMVPGNVFEALAVENQGRETQLPTATVTPIKNENEDVVYTTKADERWNYKMALTKQTDKLSVFIMKCLRENRIFYSSNEVGEALRNYVMWSDSYSIKN